MATHTYLYTDAHNCVGGFGGCSADDSQPQRKQQPPRQANPQRPPIPTPPVFLSIASVVMSPKGFLFKLDNFLVLLCYQHIARLHHLFVHTRVSSVCFFCPCVYLAQTLFLLPCLAQTWDIGVSSAFAVPSAQTHKARLSTVFSLHLWQVWTKPALSSPHKLRS